MTNIYGTKRAGCICFWIEQKNIRRIWLKWDNYVLLFGIENLGWKSFLAKHTQTYIQAHRTHAHVRLVLTLYIGTVSSKAIAKNINAFLLSWQDWNLSFWWHQKVGFWPVQCITTVTVSRTHIRGVVIPSLTDERQGWAFWGPLHCCLTWKEGYNCWIILPYNFPRTPALLV